MNERIFKLLAALAFAAVATGCASMAGSMIGGGIGSLSGNAGAGAMIGGGIGMLIDIAD